MQHQSLFPKITLPFAAMALAALAWAAVLEGDQRTFATPREAAQALLDAAEPQDGSAISAIFGKSADEILNSGDAVEDKNNLARFLKRAKQSILDNRVG